MPLDDLNEVDGDCEAPIGLLRHFVVEVKYVDLSFFVGLRHAPARVLGFILVALIRALDDCVDLQGRSDVTGADSLR